MNVCSAISLRPRENRWPVLWLSISGDRTNPTPHSIQCTLTLTPCRVSKERRYLSLSLSLISLLIPVPVNMHETSSARIERLAFQTPLFAGYTAAIVLVPAAIVVKVVGVLSTPGVAPGNQGIYNSSVKMENPRSV